MPVDGAPLESITAAMVRGLPIELGDKSFVVGKRRFAGHDYAVRLNDGLENAPVLKGLFDTNWEYRGPLVLFDSAAARPAAPASRPVSPERP